MGALEEHMICGQAISTEDVALQIEQRLRRSIVTASNDDLSKPGTPERQRHVERLSALEDAADFLRDHAFIFLR